MARIVVSVVTGATSKISVAVLGPVDTRVAGVSRALGGPRQRAVLTMLALEPGRPVSVTRMVEALWDGQEPAGAVNAVQVYVSRLRRALGPQARNVVQAVPGGYRLELAPAAVDVTRFETAVESGRALLEAGQLARSVDELSAALQLWRGEPLADLGRSADGLRARLHARRLAAVGDRIDAELGLGRQAAVLPELEELVRSHPLDEALVGRWMTALYRCGRQADALAAYVVTTQRLADQLGVRPGAALRRLHAQVLRQEVVEVTRPA